LAKASDKIATAMAEGEQAAADIAGLFQEYSQFRGVMASLKVELPLTIQQTVTELRARAAAVLAGHGQALLPQPAPAPQPAQPPAPNVEVVSVQNVAFLQDGVVQTKHAG
jgi:hypothetical protein